MGNQASCCTQNKEIVPSEFHFNTPTAACQNQFPGLTTLQDNSTDPTSGLRKQTYTDFSVRTQQDLTDNARDLEPKKKKKLVRKKPPPLTDLGSLQDCSGEVQDPVPYQASEKKDLENETEYESMDRKKGAECWINTDEDRNLSVRLSEKRTALRERTANVTYREENLSERLRKDGVRGIQSRKDVIEAGVVAQKCGEDDDIEIQFEEDIEEVESPQKEGYIVRNQHNAYQGVMSSYERHYRSMINEGLTEVFETPREEAENTDRVNHPYGVERDFGVPHDATLQARILMGSKTDRSSQGKQPTNRQMGHNGNGVGRRVQNIPEDEVQKTVSTIYEDAVSCSLHYGRREQENYERGAIDTDLRTLGNESARSHRKPPSRSQGTPLSGRRRAEYQDPNREESYSPIRTHERNFQECEGKTSARDRSREDPAKLLSGLYHTCQSVVPAEPIDMSPVNERPDFEREGQMRRSFCGEDRKLFVSEILKNIQMKNNKEREISNKVPQRENILLVKSEKEKDSSTPAPELNRRESVQRDVQKLMESAFKPRNSLLENMLKQSRIGGKDWKEDLERKSEYSHPFEHAARDSIREIPQQEQREQEKRNRLETPGFKNEGGLDKSWDSYTIQERKDMLLTKRFMDVPVNGFENK